MTNCPLCGNPAYIVVGTRNKYHIKCPYLHEYIIERLK